MALDDGTAWDMTDEDTTQGGSNVLPGGIVSPQGSMDINGLLRSVMAQQPVQLPQMPTRSPSDGTSPGWLGLLGEALAGGQSPLYKLRGAQEDTAGSRALLNFGINMMLASGPSPVKPSLFSAAAAGLQGAQQSMDQSQQAAYTQAGQQFAQQQALAQLGIQQQDARIKQLAAVLPLLRLQGAAGLQSPFGAPGTTATAPGNQPLPTMPPEYEQYFQQASKTYNIPVAVLKAVAANESGFNPNAVNKDSGALGIMQMLPSTAAKPGYGISGVSNPDQALRDPATSIMLGAAYLRARAGNADLSNPANLTTALNAYGGDKNYAANVLRFLPSATAATPPTAAPYRVASNAPVAPPTATTTPATTTPAPAPTVDLTGPRALPPVGTSTPYATPATIANTPQMVPRPQLPPSPTTQPPVTPAVPAPPTQQQTPPTPDVTAPPPPAPQDLPDEQLTREAYIAKHWVPPSAQQVKNATVGGDTAQNKELADQADAVQRAQEAADKAKQTYDIAQRAATQGITGMGDVNKSLTDLNNSNKALADAKNQYNQLVQQADTSTAANLMKLDQDQTTQLSTAYGQMLDRAQKPQLQAQAEAATAAQNALQRQSQENIERMKAGLGFHTKLEEDAAQQAQSQFLTPMSTQALKAHQINMGLSQLQPLLSQLPPGGGAVGYLLNQNPELAPLLNAAGVINTPQADATRLINGLVANISTEMKPTGLGALREYEFDAFKAQLPNLLETPAGQQKALAYVMNLNNRIQQESQWMQNYYTRQIPDEMSQKPGAMRKAFNLDSQNGQSAWQQMEQSLGPVVPSYTPPQGQNMSGSGQNAWEATLPPGKPFYRTYVQRSNPKDPNSPLLRDSQGNLATTKSLEVRPWQ